MRVLSLRRRSNHKLLLLILLLGPLSPVVCCAQNDEQLRSALQQVAQLPQSIAIAISYRVCPKDLDEGYQLDVSIPLVIKYVPPSANDMVVTPSARAIDLTLPPSSISVGNTPSAFTDQNSTGIQLDAGQAKSTTKLLGQQADAIKGFLTGTGGSQALSDILMRSFSNSLQNVLRAQGDSRSVRARLRTGPNLPTWPALELCAGSSPVVAATARPRDEQLRARGAFPVGESAQAQMVMQILKDAAGKPIAYRETEVQLATPPGTFTVTHAPAANQTPQGPPGVKIVNGVLVQQGAMPWSVAFVMRNPAGKLMSFCGGSLVGDRWVLTAAHCRTEGSSVVVNRVDINGTGGFDRKVKTVWRHINFAKEERYDSDLSLVELSDAVAVKPIDFLGVDELTPVTAIGWGATQEGGDPVPLLHSVELDVVAEPTCKFAYRNEPTRVTDRMLCANRPHKDACQGDSGGALLRVGPDNTWRIAGVVSFGKGCASPNYPGVYTKLAAFGNWANEVEVAVRRQSNQ